MKLKTKKLKKSTFKNGVYFCREKNVIIELINGTVFDGINAYKVNDKQIKKLFGTKFKRLKV